MRHMKMIQIRNVPDDVHAELKARSAAAGMTLTDYLLRELTELAEHPTLQDVLARIRSREPVEISESSADAVRAERESRY